MARSIRRRALYGTIATAFSVAVIIAGVGSCSLFANLTADVPAAADARTEKETGEVEAGLFDDGCRHATPPDKRPGMKDGEGEPPFYAAMKSMKFVGDFGFDLDDRCTCSPHDGGRCLPRVPADAAAAASGNNRSCDGDGGVDNAFGKLADATIGPLLDSTVKRSIESGDYSLLFRIDRYNGEPNDASVSISFFRSVGPARDGGVDGPTIKPTFTKEDAWTIDRDSVQNEVDVTAKESVDEAYVIDGLLVARMSGPLTLHRGLRITINAAVLTASIKRDEAGDFYLENVVVGGRWAAKSVIEAAGVLELEENVPLCRSPLGPNVWSLARTQICESLDVARTNNEDDKSDCSALSIAARIETVAVVKKPQLETNKPLFDTCPDAASIVKPTCD